MENIQIFLNVCKFKDLGSFEVWPWRAAGNLKARTIEVKKVEFVSDRMSYIILRGCWCNNILLNVHAPTEDKIDDMKDRFYEELEQAFDKFWKYQMKMLLGDINAEVGRKTFSNQQLCYALRHYYCKVGV
jgi:hypothetical protein